MTSDSAHAAVLFEFRIQNSEFRSQKSEFRIETGFGVAQAASVRCQAPNICAKAFARVPGCELRDRHRTAGGTGHPARCLSPIVQISARRCGQCSNASSSQLRSGGLRRSGGNAWKSALLVGGADAGRGPCGRPGKPFSPTQCPETGPPRVAGDVRHGLSHLSARHWRACVGEARHHIALKSMFLICSKGSGLRHGATAAPAGC